MASVLTIGGTSWGGSCTQPALTGCRRHLLLLLVLGDLLCWWCCATLLGSKGTG